MRHEPKTGATMLSWYEKTLEECFSHFQTNATEGLSDEVVKRRQESSLARLPQVKKDTFFLRLARQFSSPIIFILVAAMIATLFLHDYTESIVILLALLVNITMGLIQEGRASQAFEALRKSQATYAVVLRGGEVTRIATEEVVLGDIVLLMAGASVPADIRLIETHSLSVDESLLSGEWFPVEKSIERIPFGAPLTERTNMAYAGTVVTSGTGKGIAVGIGSSTEIGELEKNLIGKKKAETPLTRDIKDIAKIIVIAVLLVVVGISGLGFLRGLSLDEIITTAIALAVSSVPEGLPAAVTVVLALGMERILRAGGLVRSLLAAETLGTTSIILTDKTGTLTEGKMTVDSLITFSGIHRHESFEEKEPRALITAGVLASSAYIEERTEPTGENKLVAHGRPVEQALTLTGLQLGITKKELGDEYVPLDDFAFDSTNRFGGSLVTYKKNSVGFFVGAPELFLAEATHIRDGQGKKHAFDEVMKARFSESLASAAHEGKRVVAIAQKTFKENSFDANAGAAILASSELLGFVVFSDPIRSEVPQAVEEIQGAGMRIIMLTGDNPQTALSIATQAGIVTTHECVHTGADLDELSDAEVISVLHHCHVFARVSPAHKLRIASLLTGDGETIAMTGDGVNDAPALRAATIGVAVGSGTDVAKESSELVLLQNGFSVITAAIKEGRRLRDNFKKIFTYMLSTNFAEVALITTALAIGLPLPLLPTQILWANLVSGSLMNFAFAFEPLHASTMKRKPSDSDVRHVLSKNVLQLIAFVGTCSSLLLVGVYLYLTSLGIPLEKIQTIMFIGISINSIFVAFSIKSFSTPLWNIPLLSNKFLLLAMLSSAFLLFIALFVPFMQVFLETVPIAPLGILLCLLFGVGNMVIIETAKWFFFIRTIPRAV